MTFSKPQSTSVTMMRQSRRQFAKLSVAALSGASFFGALTRLGSAESTAKTDARPYSKVAGVQIGLNVPYSFGNGNMSGDEILKNCVELGLSGVELRTQPVEAFLGAPSFPKGTPASEVAEKLAAWRKSAPLDRVGEFRKQYETA